MEIKKHNLPVAGILPRSSVPIPQNGLEVIWNHLLRYRGEQVHRNIVQATPTASGTYNLVYIQEKLTDVDPNDPTFEALRDAARDVVESTRIHFDIENPKNWGINSQGEVVLRDP